jgi:hypothetical protein
MDKDAVINGVKSMLHRMSLQDLVKLHNGLCMPGEPLLDYMAAHRGVPAMAEVSNFDVNGNEVPEDWKPWDHRQ